MSDQEIIAMLKEECGRLEDELKKSRQDLEIQVWGMNKTNEAVKVLYKELEKKNNELRALDKLKSEFINTVSHELRTPLTSIRESVSQVLDGVHGQVNAAQRDFLSICLQDINRLKRTVDDLLDVSKIEAGKFKVERKAVDIINLARRVILTFGPQAKNKNLLFKENISCTEAVAFVDEDSIIRVFTNLIGNAVKFTESGSIEVSVSDRDAMVECSVSDTGRGIADEDLPKVFGKFQQFGRMYGPGEKGTGLGLNISKGIIELNRGKIWLESQLNKGTKFTFTLPKYEPARLYEEYIAEPAKRAVRQKAVFSILVFSAKGPDAPLKELETMVRHKLRPDDVSIPYAQRVFVPLPEVEKEMAAQILNRVCRDIAGTSDFSCEIISVPADGLTEELLCAKLTGH